MVVPEVPILCPGGTVVCIASGPSLTSEDVEYCRGKADAVVVINSSWKLAPWADVLYAADAKWWNEYQGVPDFHGLKFSLQKDAAKWGVHVLQDGGDRGLALARTHLRTGKNSGFQSINLAVHLGAKRILLLGYDLSRGPNGETHWHGDHPERIRGNDRPEEWLPWFDTLVQPLKKISCEVINCSRRTLLTTFPQMPITEALK